MGHLSWNKYLQGSFPNSDTERLETQCFKSVWVTVALHEGLTFPTSYGHLTAAPNTVHGQVVHWTLGALLYRTRFFPLRAISSDGGVHHGTYHSNLSSGYLFSLHCLALPTCCLILYCYICYQTKAICQAEHFEKGAESKLLDAT